MSRTVTCKNKAETKPNEDVSWCQSGAAVSGVCRAPGAWERLVPPALVTGPCVRCFWSWPPLFTLHVSGQVLNSVRSRASPLS